jgi:hypothetical protein
LSERVFLRGIEILYNIVLDLANTKLWMLINLQIITWLFLVIVVIKKPVFFTVIFNCFIIPNPTIKNPVFLVSM